MRYRNHNKCTGFYLLRRKYLNYKNKMRYAHENKHKDPMLESGFLTSQTWGGLCKAWVAYVISQKKDNEDNKRYYAGVIQKLQNELGIRMTSFPELEMIALGYFRDNAEFMDKEMTGEEIFKILMDRDIEIGKQFKKEEEED